MVYIVGLGPGSKEYMLLKAINILENSQVILGFKRALESVDFVNVPKHPVKNLEEMLSYISLNGEKEVSIVASGDPCFYGVSDYIKKNYQGDFEIVPGISSFQYFMAKLNKSWQGSHLGSVHGREEDLLGNIKSHEVSIWLTDKVNSPKAICRKLYEEGLKVKVYVGENLSYSDEKITIGSPEKLMENEFSDLAVVVIENDLH